MATRRLWSVGAVVFLSALSPRAASAQGDGPRLHWKEVLTNTNLFSFTSLRGSGNVNPLDPAHTIAPDADFNADLALFGFSRSFGFSGRTAVASILLPVGNMEEEIAGPPSSQDSNRGFGDPILQLDMNLIGAPAMRNIPELLRYDPRFTMDLVCTLGVPIGEYDNDSRVNIGQNRWFGRIGLPMMVNLGQWVPGRKTTLEVLPALWLFEDNDDFVGQTLENDPMFQLEVHLTRDFTDKLWGSLGMVYYSEAEPTIAGVPGNGLSEIGVGLTAGFTINDNVMLTAGYTSTVGDDSGDLDLGTFRISLVYGWHRLIEGIRRLDR